MTDNASDDFTNLMQQRGVAFVFKPTLQRIDENTWQARYPAASWCGSGNTEDEAMASLRELMLAHTKPDDWQLAAAREHLTNGPLAGVYEIPLEANERAMNSSNPKAALDALISEIDEQRAKAKV